MHAYNSIMRISNRQFSFYRMSIFAIRENKKKKEFRLPIFARKTRERIFYIHVQDDSF